MIVRVRRALTVLLVAACCSIPQTATGGEIDWNDEWPKYRVSEGIATGVLFAGGAAVELGLNPPESGNWRGPILLDRPVRNAIAADSPEVAEGFGLASDVTVGTLMAYPFAVDVGIAGLAIHRDPSTSLQLALIGAESFAVSTFLMTAGKYFVARQRPPSPDCSQEGKHNLYCSEERFESFPSGHTTYAFTGASYLCAVHENVDLYGGGWSDRIACWAGLGVATGSGLSRMVSDNHYFSDVAAGAAIGFASGYVLPKVLHFGWGDSTPESAGLRPMIAPRPRGIAVTGTF